MQDTPTPSKGNYFQFPLSLLRQKGSLDTLMDDIVLWSISDCGRRADPDCLGMDSGTHLEGEEMKLAHLRNSIEECLSDGTVVLGEGLSWREWDEEKENYWAGLGYAITGAIGGSLKAAARSHARLSCIAKGGAKIRLKTSIAFAIRDGDGITPEEGRFLCALYSAIGDKPFKLITKGEIASRMVGYLPKDLPRVQTGKSKGNPQSYLKIPNVQKVYRIMKRLHERDFFAKVSPSRRENFFSHRMGRDELSVEVEKWKLKKHAKREAIAGRDSELQKRIRRTKQTETLRREVAALEAKQQEEEELARLQARKAALQGRTITPITEGEGFGIVPGEEYYEMPDGKQVSMGELADLGEAARAVTLELGTLKRAEKLA